MTLFYADFSYFSGSIYPIQKPVLLAIVISFADSLSTIDCTWIGKMQMRFHIDKARFLNWIPKQVSFEIINAFRLPVLTCKLVTLCSINKSVATDTTVFLDIAVFNSLILYNVVNIGCWQHEVAWLNYRCNLSFNLVTISLVLLLVVIYEYIRVGDV